MEYLGPEGPMGESGINWAENAESRFSMGPVVYFETDFVEQGQKFLRAARNSLYLTHQKMAWYVAQVQQIIHDAVYVETPVGPDAWHHVGGSLRKSTDVSVADAVETDFNDYGRPMQAAIIVTQDATNPRGTEYAAFVINGHETRNHASYVGGRPYPQHALATVWPEVTAMLGNMAREVAEETVQYLTYDGAK